MNNVQLKRPMQIHDRSATAVADEGFGLTSFYLELRDSLVSRERESETESATSALTVPHLVTFVKPVVAALSGMRPVGPAAMAALLESGAPCCSYSAAPAWVRAPGTRYRSRTPKPQVWCASCPAYCSRWFCPVHVKHCIYRSFHPSAGPTSLHWSHKGAHSGMSTCLCTLHQRCEACNRFSGPSVDHTPCSFQTVLTWVSCLCRVVQAHSQAKARKQRRAQILQHQQEPRL